jgi:hypothetical protein
MSAPRPFPVMKVTVIGVVVAITLGVRLAKLEATYATPPSLKPAKGNEDWTVVGSSQLVPAQYLIPVDEFAEVELQGLRVLTRKELRDICNAAVTKEAIMRALVERMEDEG